MIYIFYIKIRKAYWMQNKFQQKTLKKDGFSFL